MKCGGSGKSVRGRKRCSGIYTCQVLEENTEFKSTQTGERYKIRQDIDCKSENIIYLVTCKKCGFQGVGSYTNCRKEFQITSQVLKRSLQDATLENIF